MSPANLQARIDVGSMKQTLSGWQANCNLTADQPSSAWPPSENPKLGSVKS